MSAGWEIGDLALCVYEGDDWSSLDKSNVATPAPQLGCTYTVLHIGECQGLVGLGLIEFGPNKTFYAPRFRKILPDKHEACETEFVTLLNRIKQPVEAERSALFMGGE